MEVQVTADTLHFIQYLGPTSSFVVDDSQITFRWIWRVSKTAKEIRHALNDTSGIGCTNCRDICPMMLAMASSDICEGMPLVPAKGPKVKEEEGVELVDAEGVEEEVFAVGMKTILLHHYMK